MTKPPDSIEPEIVHHYQEFDENSRLQVAFGQLEFARTMELLSRHFPPPPARVLDIGGGTGPYAEALGKAGYETHLLDPMPHHVAMARSRADIASVRVGDARQLDWPASFADAVLLLGPLYHLVDVADRRQALLEARRVLKPGGLLAVAAISRFASLLDGFTRGTIDDPRFLSIVLQDLGSGEHQNTTDNPLYFTHAYFHLPAELADDVAQAGFSQPEVFAVEGPVWSLHDFEERWSNQEKRSLLLDLIRRIEQQPSLLGASAHLLAFAHSPQSLPCDKV